MAKFKTEDRYFTADSVQVTLAGANRSESGKMIWYGFTIEDHDRKTPLTIARSIRYKVENPSRHKCNARCQSATGPNCECECGGKNHGGN